MSNVSYFMFLLCRIHQYDGLGMVNCQSIVWIHTVRLCPVSEVYIGVCRKISEIIYLLRSFLGFTSCILIPSLMRMGVEDGKLSNLYS